MPNTTRFFSAVVLLVGVFLGQLAQADTLTLVLQTFSPKHVAEVVAENQRIVAEKEKKAKAEAEAEQERKAAEKAANRAKEIELAKTEASKPPPEVERYVTLGKKVGTALAAAEEASRYKGDNFLQSEVGMSVLRQIQFEIMVGDRLLEIHLSLAWLGLNVLVVWSYLKHHKVRLMPTGRDENGKPINYELATLVQGDESSRKSSREVHFVVWIIGNIVLLVLSIIMWW